MVHRMLPRMLPDDWPTPGDLTGRDLTFSVVKAGDTMPQQLLLQRVTLR